MTHNILVGFLWILLLNNGTCEPSGTFERIYYSEDQVTCTGNLSCTISSVWCLPGDIEEATHPVLVPRSVRPKTVLRCSSEDCHPCVQVELDMHVAYRSDWTMGKSEDGCEDYYEDNGEDGASSDEDLWSSSPWNDSSGESDINELEPSLCANLFIAYVMPPTLGCVMVKVWMPLSSVPSSQGNTSVEVGKVVFNCLNASIDNDMALMSYTVPRYQEVLNNTCELPGCNVLRFIPEVKQCQVPNLQYTAEEFGISVGITNGSEKRSYELKILHNKTKIKQVTLNGNERYHIPEEDLVPCLCFQVWWSDLFDAPRPEDCPFTKYDHLEKNVWKKSNLSVNLQNEVLLYNFSAPCKLPSVELSVCWKYGRGSHCQELPSSRRKIESQGAEPVGDLKLHSSLCVQVFQKDQRRHIQCLPVNDSHSTEQRSEVLVLVSHLPEKNVSSLCLIEKDNCTDLYNSTHHMVNGAGFFKEKIVENYFSGHCMKIWSNGGKQKVFVCSMDKYMPQRWKVYSVIALFCVLLLLYIFNKHLRKWVKLATSEKSLGEIFMDRRVFIVYSADDPAYAELVNVLATSLKELRLTVVLDQWHRVDMCSVNPMLWYHRQKSLICKENGIILVLLSEDANEKFHKWSDRTSHELPSRDPYCAFGAALNCIHPDFLDGSAVGRYVVASFSRIRIPQILQTVPFFILPTETRKLLKELSGPNRRKLKKKQLNRLSAAVNERLQKLSDKYQCNGHQKTGSSVSSRETLSVNYEGNEPVEICPLI
ncbi:interleukin-17 receptor C [Spea bombifrons]|uniref:interleukin-17 receptor C n=1 Tax=Spea bombifrons TaxID=233779 RepID=UPI00234B5CDC|nr:interleukin-17 receptor C [Spea bombifrons]